MTYQQTTEVEPQQTSRVALAIAWIASPLAVVGIAAVAIAAWELNASEDSSLVADLYQTRGWGEAAQLQAVREAEAAHANRMAAAEESERRLTLAYQKVFDTYSQSYAALGDVARRAADLELEVGRLQSRELRDSNTFRRWGTMGADVLCGLEMLSGGTSDLNGSCDLADDMRQDLVNSYGAIQNSRQDYASDVLSRFPNPTELIRDLEQERARISVEFKLNETGDGE